MADSPPRKETYYEMLLRLAGHLVVASTLLGEFLAEPGRRDELRRVIAEIDQAAQGLAHEIATRLHRTLIAPLDREDLRALATGMEAAIRRVHDGARILETERITEANDAALRLADLMRRSSRVIEAGINHLWQADAVLEVVQEIQRLEAEAISVREQAVRELFASERDPLDVIKYKDLYEKLNEAVRASGKVANTLESIALKQR